MHNDRNNNINPSIVTRDVQAMAEITGNVYASLAVISKRARQIATGLKEELNGKLAEFAIPALKKSWTANGPSLPAL